MSESIEPKLPYVQTGGARLGRSYLLAMNWTTPFAEIKVEPEKITLTMGWRNLTFRHDQVESINVLSGFLSTGIRIRHNVVEHSPFVVFWTVPYSNLEILTRALGQAGFAVAPPVFK